MSSRGRRYLILKKKEGPSGTKKSPAHCSKVPDTERKWKVLRAAQDTPENMAPDQRPEGNRWSNVVGLLYCLSIPKSPVVPWFYPDRHFREALYNQPLVQVNSLEVNTVVALVS
jgi:hypothetical protein